MEVGEKSTLYSKQIGLQMKNEPQIKLHLEENWCQTSVGGCKMLLAFLADIDVALV